MQNYLNEQHRQLQDLQHAADLRAYARAVELNRFWDEKKRASGQGEVSDASSSGAGNTIVGAPEPEVTHPPTPEVEEDVADAVMADTADNQNPEPPSAVDDPLPVSACAENTTSDAEGPSGCGRSS